MSTMNNGTLGQFDNSLLKHFKIFTKQSFFFFFSGQIFSPEILFESFVEDVASLRLCRIVSGRSAQTDELGKVCVRSRWGSKSWLDIFLFHHNYLSLLNLSDIFHNPMNSAKFAAVLSKKNHDLAFLLKLIFLSFSIYQIGFVNRWAF